MFIFGLNNLYFAINYFNGFYQATCLTRYVFLRLLQLISSLIIPHPHVISLETATHGPGALQIILTSWTRSTTTIFQ